MADSDRRELLQDLPSVFRVAGKTLQASLWTALPGILVDINLEKMTCSVQPAIKAKVLDYQGNSTWVQLPLLVDCPIVFPSGGGFTLTFPLSPGDEVLVVFSSRCIDSWWQSGGVQVQAELRLHDLSDGFVIPGPRSQPNVIPAINNNAVELRSNAGDALVSIATSGDITASTFANAYITAGNVEVVAQQVVNVTAPDVIVRGNVTIDGTLRVTGKVIAADLATDTLTSYENHVHLSRTDGSARTGTPIAGT